MSSSAARPNLVIPNVRLRSRATVAWLETAIGFTVTEVTPDDEGGLRHAQLWWGEDCIMVSTSGEKHEQVGVAGLYLTVETAPEVDVAYERAVAAGAVSVREPEDQPYGGRGATVADPEGNSWSFGNYFPQPPAQHLTE